jgi:hypothetical protein
MNDHLDLELDYRGHHVHVSHVDVPHKWPGEHDTVFTVLIDGDKTVLPGIWRAYKTGGEKGVRLVVQAYLNGEPRGTVPESS